MIPLAVPNSSTQRAKTRLTGERDHALRGDPKTLISLAVPSTDPFGRPLTVLDGEEGLPVLPRQMLPVQLEVARCVGPEDLAKIQLAFDSERQISHGASTWLCDLRPFLWSRERKT